MSLADAEMRHRHQRAQPMSMTTDRKRTIEARLDAIVKRLDAQRPYPGDPPNPLVGIMKGMVDVMRDVLLEDDR